MAEQDYYQILGLRKGASEAEIKKGYRRLARKLHPDVNPGDRNAEERFKKVQTAYQVLSDPEKRKIYDRYGFYSEGIKEQAGQPFSGFDFGEFQNARQQGSFRDIISELFGSARTSGPSGARRPRSTRGSDLEFEITIPFMAAINGVERRVSVLRQVEGDGTVQKNEVFKVRIPAGVDSGSRVRVPSKGHAGRDGGPAGDLYLKVNVESHPFFRRRGRDILCEVPVTFTEAALGTRIEVPTIGGKALLRIPPGTQSGQKLRMRGRGLPAAQSGPAGDQLVEVKIMVPQIRDERSKEILREFAQLNPEDPRSQLGA